MASRSSGRGRRIGHPLVGDGLSIAEFVDRCPANNILWLGPLAQKRRFPDPGKTGEEGMTVLLNEVGEFLKFLSFAR